MTKKKAVAKTGKQYVDAAVTFDCTAMTKTTDFIDPNAGVATPYIMYSEEVYALITHLTTGLQRSDEIGWMMSTTYDEASGEIYVHDLYIPKQVVSAVATAMDKEDYSRVLLEEFIPDAKEYGAGLHLNAWYHLHPKTLGVSPSAQDEQQVAEYLADNTHWPYFVRGIMNGQGKVKVDVFLTEHNLRFTCVDTYVDRPQFTDQINKLNTIIKANVSKELPVVPKGAGNYTKQAPKTSPTMNYNYSGYLASTDEYVYDDYVSVTGEIKYQSQSASSLYFRVDGVDYEASQAADGNLEIMNLATFEEVDFDWNALMDIEDLYNDYVLNLD